MTIEDDVARHYTHGSLEAAVDQSLEALGKTPASITHDDLVQIDEFHVGGRAATHRLIASCDFRAGQTLLEVGSGLGGPARTIAATSGATVVGIDLTPEFVAVAANLSRRVGLADRTSFHAGSALATPFEPARFDGATLIHVGMNIADKAALFREVRRVLKPGATFGIYDIMRSGDGDLTFPLPWSSVPATSFVERPEVYKAALAAAGFDVVAETDRVPEAMAFFKATAEQQKIQQVRLTFRGQGFKEKAQNLNNLIVAGVIGPREIIARAV